MYKVEKENGRYKVTGGIICSCGYVYEDVRYCDNKKDIPSIQENIKWVVDHKYEEHKKEQNHIRHKKLERILNE